MAALLEISTLRKIVGAIVLLPIVGLFLIIVLTTMGHLPVHRGAAPFLVPFELFAAGLGVVTGCIGRIVRGSMWRRGRELGAPEHKNLAYASGVLVHAASLEAGMLLNLVVMVLIEHPWPNLVVMVALLALALTSLPSEEQRKEVMRLGG